MPRTRARSSAHDLALVATFAALVVVLGTAGQLNLFGNAVPITLQTLGVMLAGAVLGARRGALACLVVLALCAVGLPVLAGGRGGVGVFAGATVGYLVGWPLGAAVTGWLVQRARRRNTPRLLPATVVGGIGVVYLVGVPVQALVLGTSLPATALLSLVFLPGDLVKAVVAAGVAAGVHRAYPDLLPRRGTARLAAPAAQPLASGPTGGAR